MLATPAIAQPGAAPASLPATRPMATDRPGPPGPTIARLQVRFWDDEHTIAPRPTTVDVRMVGALGAAEGYETLRAATADLGRITASDDSLAAVVRRGDRWFGIAAYASMPGNLTPWPTQLETTDVGGVVRAAKDWRMPGLAALVDGTWVHRFHASPRERRA
jgi:hypothetical protein